ncbi:unnamed protein product [Oncorhynchus mykiss]|uniref:Uncharacterized protein n=1 Tax=Oncorhynchus mykiss TaxID=8022 RepID=A0A060WHF6_ONCMY|nr:unnamed protein product [Oncorhynchus mykiss]
MVCIHTENQDQASFCPSAPLEVSVLHKFALGHLRYRLTGVPPQSKSAPATVPGAGGTKKRKTRRVVVFHGGRGLPLILHLSCLFTSQALINNIKNVYVKTFEQYTKKLDAEFSNLNFPYKIEAPAKHDMKLQIGPSEYEKR